MERKDAELFALGADDPDFSRPDSLIDVYRGLSYDATS
jgi:hypothetical protein